VKLSQPTAGTQGNIRRKGILDECRHACADGNCPPLVFHAGDDLQLLAGEKPMRTLASSSINTANNCEFRE